MLQAPIDLMRLVEHQLRVRFIMQFYEEHWKEGPTLQEVIASFNIDTLGGLLNHFLFPMALSVQQQILPPFDQMHEHWVPWDYRLRPDQRLVVVICDLALFRAMARVASGDLMDFLDLRPHRRFGPHYEEITLTLHYIPMTEVIYRIGSLAEQLSQTQMQTALATDRARAAELRFAALEQDVAVLQRTLGICIEAVCSQSPELAPLFARWRGRD